jgi:preprotein translocase subunit SecF
VRATSALFIAVYVLALVSAARILDGRVRAAAVVALGATLVLGVFSSWYLAVPVAAAVASLALRRLVRPAEPASARGLREHHRRENDGRAEQLHTAE